MSLSLRSLLLCVYLAHGISSFGDRLWQFAIPLVLSSIYPNSLFGPSLFLLVNYLIKIIFIPIATSSIRHQLRTRTR